MKRLCILIIILNIIILNFLFNKKIYAPKYPFKNKVYYKYYNCENSKITRDYSRSNVRVNFYQINYLQDKNLEKEINYLIEKFSFKTIYRILKDIYKLYENKNITFKDILYWIDNLENEKFIVNMYPIASLDSSNNIFELGYIDENMINIYYTIDFYSSGVINEKNNDYYGNHDVSYYKETGNFILDINTKEEIKLSDFIEIDERLTDYKIEDGITDYNTEVLVEYKNFKDAFKIYINEEDRDSYHYESLDKVLRKLKDNKYTWYLNKNKDLVFILDDGFNFVRFRVDYEFIKPLLKEDYKEF